MAHDHRILIVAPRGDLAAKTEIIPIEDELTIVMFVVETGVDRAG